MIINTKFYPNQPIYLVFVEDGEIHINKDIIDYISIYNNEYLYTTKNYCEEFKEEEIAKDIEEVNNIIEKILNEKRQKR